MRTADEALPSGAAGGRVRFTLPKDVERFVQEGMAAGPGEAEYLDEAEARREDVMLGLRLVEGVSAETVAAAGLEGVLADLADRGLVENAEGRWRTTEPGWLCGNEVFGAVWGGV